MQITKSFCHAKYFGLDQDFGPGNGKPPKNYLAEI